jgi:hypothetical protein
MSKGFLQNLVDPEKDVIIEKLIYIFLSMTRTILPENISKFEFLKTLLQMPKGKVSDIYYEFCADYADILLDALECYSDGRLFAQGVRTAVPDLTLQELFLVAVYNNYTKNQKDAQLQIQDGPQQAISTPAVPIVRAVPTIPTIPAVPTIPDVSTVPAVPIVPTIPAVRAVRAVPDVRDVRDGPTIPAVPDVRAGPTIPAVPVVRAVPDKIGQHDLNFTCGLKVTSRYEYTSAACPGAIKILNVPHTVSKGALLVRVVLSDREVPSCSNYKFTLKEAAAKSGDDEYTCSTWNTGKSAYFPQCYRESLRDNSIYLSITIIY